MRRRGQQVGHTPKRCFMQRDAARPSQLHTDAVMLLRLMMMMMMIMLGSASARRKC